MANITISDSNAGTALLNLLMCDDIEPGSEPSYEICKEISIFHPLGEKLASKPIELAQSQKREISIPNSPELMLQEAFESEWQKVGADASIFNVMRTSRVYGASAVVCGQDGQNDQPLDLSKLAEGDIYFNIYDPLNVAGSLVLNQNPNAPDFQKKLGPLQASGMTYHASRCCVVFNGPPIYLAYTSSSYGYVGRSVYQRILYPLKSFVQSMITDDLVTVKAGLLIAKMKQPGSIINRVMQAAFNVKRTLLQIARTGNVLSIAPDEDIETLNLTNTDTAMTTARKNIIENIATGAPMPALLINNETYAEGFGEGSEDAADVARYIEGIRREMAHVYAFFDRIVMHRAWNKVFFEAIKNEFPDLYGGKDYVTVFVEWKNNFVASWPNLLKEPPSKEADVEDVKLKAMIAFLEVAVPEVDPKNKAALFQWAQDNINALKLLFPVAMDLDLEALAAYVPPVPVMGDKPQEEPEPFSKAA